MKSTKRVRFSIEISKEMVEVLLNLAVTLEEDATGRSFIRADLRVAWPRLAAAIVAGLHEGRRRVIFSLPEDEEILISFEQVLQQRSFDLVVQRDKRRLFLHTQAALVSIRRPWLIQLADAING